MTTIADLAHEFNAQPHEIAAFGDLGNMPQDAELDADTEAAIREAWDSVSAEMTTAEQNAAEDRVLEDVAEIIDGPGGNLWD
jgi:hypothetical protein